MTKEVVLDILKGVVHPETGSDIVSMGLVEMVTADENKVGVTLSFEKSRDPFALSIKRQIVELITTADSCLTGNVVVIIKESAPKKVEKKADKHSFTDQINKVIAIASGKGGVGKSTVTANLAVALTQMGYSVGIIDADVYGPSQPKMFGVEGYMPEGGNEDGVEYMMPAIAHGVKIMSIGFFIKRDDALVWRGPMATNALKQLIHQTKWGALDFLLIDLPPGTGDVHLTVLQELKIDGALIVSTPQQVALADVLRGIKMFEAPKIEIPILGIIENMAWFTPAELPNNRYYIFGRDGAKKMAKELNIELLGEIPIIESVMEGAEKGVPITIENNELKTIYKSVAQKIITKLE